MEKEIVFLSSKLLMGGAERVACSLANWIVKNTNDNVTFLIFGDSDIPYELDKKVKIVSIQFNSKNKTKNILDRINFCKNHFKEIKVDIIFAMFPIIELYALLSKPKHSVLIGSERCNINETSIFRKLLSRFCSKRCDGFIFQTERIKSFYPKLAQNKSTVIYNAMSNKKVLDMDINSIKKENLITAMGRLDEQKGFDILIKSFKKASLLYPGYKLLIFGEGNERNNLDKLIKDLDLKDRVVLCGNDPDAVKTIAKSKVFVLSSRYEGMPNALIEAMATGTACISTDCDFGPRELIIDGENGLLTPVNDIESLSNKIIYLLNNDSIRETIEKNAILIKDKLDLNIICKQYYDYFEKVLFKKNNN